MVQFLLGLFEDNRLKPSLLRTSNGNVKTLAEPKQVLQQRINFTSSTLHKSTIFICKSTKGGN